MTKDELATELSYKANIGKSEALRVIDGLMEVMSDTFIEGEDIYLRSFGTFKIAQHKKKTAQNISKGISITIPARKVVRFIPCINLKNKIK